MAKFTSIIIFLLAFCTYQSKAQSYNPNLDIIFYDSCHNDRLGYTIQGFFYADSTMNDSIIVMKTNHNNIEQEDTIGLINRAYFEIAVNGNVGITHYKFYLISNITNQLADSVIVTKSNVRLNCNLVALYPFTDINSDCNLNPGEFVHYDNVHVYKNNQLIGVRRNSNPYIFKPLNFAAQDYNAFDTIKVVAANGSPSCMPLSISEFILDTFTNQFTMNNFPILCNQNEDFDVIANPLYRSVYASSNIVLIYNNKSCSTSSTTLTYTIPSAFSFISSSNPNYVLSGNVLTYNLNNVAAGSSGQIYINIMNTDSNLVMGDSVQHFVQIGNLATDATPAYNVDSSYIKIRGSYDPNQKSAIPERDLRQKMETIHYLVEFENLGNDTAFFVKIVDTLSEHLDYATFKITGSSHTYEYFMDDKFGHKIMRFEFPNIKLADSTDKVNNKGWISYSISTKSTMLVNDVIYNTAYIYFDNNQPIITNTTRHQILTVSAQSPVWAQNIKVYPNPINDYLIIEDYSKTINEVVVRNVLGQIVYRPTISYTNNHIQINTSMLSNGIYVIECKNEAGQSKSIKVLK